MSLGERLAVLGRARRIIRSVNLPAKLRSEEILERTEERFARISTIQQVDYKALLQKLNAVAASRSFSLLTVREMQLAASCLFDGDSPVADDGPLLDQFLDALRSLKSRTAFRRLIHCYCNHFDPNNPAIIKIGAFLTQSISDAQLRSEWRQRHRDYRLFDPSQAPEHLARLTVDTMEPWTALAKAGLRGPLIATALAVHAFRAAMNSIQGMLEANPKPEHVAQAVAWIQNDKGTHFYAQRRFLADALLLPWARRDPSVEMRNRIQDHLVKILGDPCIDLAPWLGSHQAARDVMVRWLAQATLEQFLKVVDRVAPKHQWEYRRAFWNAYIEKRKVADARVVFGSNGAQVARQIANDGPDGVMHRSGILVGGGTDQAVLLLTIGELVIADWSHDGRLRIWRNGNENAPVFSLKSHSAADLRADSDFDTVHRPPDGWQGKTEAYIRKHTNIHVSEAEYMPT